MTETHPAALAASRAVDYLAETQHEGGSWTDFWLPVGTSDAWVTAYTGLALLEASQCPRLPDASRDAARGMAEAAASWLQSHYCRQGWGYNASVPPDADSTAHAISLLARLGREVPGDALRLLEAHRVPDRGYRTYRWHDPAHQWLQPTADVTAACLRALDDAGVLDRDALRDDWNAMLAPYQREDGTWQGYWWPSDAYPTFVALEVWRRAGRPHLRFEALKTLMLDAAPFELACDLHSRCLLDDDAGAVAVAQCLIDQQQDDGAWPSARILHLPPSHVPDPAPRQVIGATDARRIFTTATVLKALARYLIEPGSLACEMPKRKERSERSQTGMRLDALVARAADALGFDSASSGQAADTFSFLTRRSLAESSPWPSAQLSTLSAGLPLEFSVAVGKNEPPALRYTTELGVPHLPPQARARTSVEALAAVSGRLGYDEAWQRVLPAVEALTSDSIAAPDGLRFWVWGGVDRALPSAGRAPLPLLKVYLNLLHREVGASDRLEKALNAAGIPLPPSTANALALLDANGFRHECGFALGPGGRIAFKLYYELPGWRPDIAAAILTNAGLNATVDDVCPEIPGLLKQSLARKRRAGIALRLDPVDGRIRELTTAAAFLPPLLPDAEVRRRVASWLYANGWDTTAYDALSAALIEDWSAAPLSRAGMHSLFTRTVSDQGASATIYMRPYLPDAAAPLQDFDHELGALSPARA